MKQGKPHRSFKFALLFMLVLLTSGGCSAPAVIIEAEKHGDTLLMTGQVSPHQLPTPSGALHYVTHGPPNRSVLLFIHGTPGDWRVFSQQMSDPKLQPFYKVAVDRPGWGGSSYQGIEWPLSLAQQSQQLLPLLRHLKKRSNSRLMIIGHSLGGSLVAQMALDHPEWIDGAVVVAGDLSEKYLPITWYNELASWKIIRPLLPANLRRANDEVLALQHDLAALKPRWNKLQVPLLVLLGAEDSLVDPKNGDFSKKLSSGSPVQVTIYDQEGHLFLMGNPALVNNAISSFFQEHFGAATPSRSPVSPLR